MHIRKQAVWGGLRGKGGRDRRGQRRRCRGVGLLWARDAEEPHSDLCSTLQQCVVCLPAGSFHAASSLYCTLYRGFWLSSKQKNVTPDITGSCTLLSSPGFMRGGECMVGLCSCWVHSHLQRQSVEGEKAAVSGLLHTAGGSRWLSVETTLQGVFVSWKITCFSLKSWQCGLTNCKMPVF